MSSKVPPQVRDCFNAAKKLDREDLARERDLHHWKWFDYRFITPYEATVQFRAQYQEVYRWKYAHNIDFREAERVTGSNQ